MEIMNHVVMSLEEWFEGLDLIYKYYTRKSECP